MLQKIKNLLVSACVLFTALAFLLYSIGALLVDYTVGISLGNALLLFATSLLLTACNKILFLPGLHMALRVILHYFVTLGASFVLFAYIGGIVSSSLATLALLSCVTLFYSAFALGYALWSTRK